MESAEGANVFPGAFPTCILLSFVPFAGLPAVARAADSIGVASAVVARSQFQSIAEESLDRAQLDPKARVSILVEGEGPRALAENAFVEALQKRNYIPVADAGTASEQSLRVFFLAFDVRVREVNTQKMERTVKTDLEIRTVNGPRRESRFLGTFHRESRDTAQTFSEYRMPPGPSREDEGALQRVLTPFIVVGGAVLIIYLFFTVRS